MADGIQVRHVHLTRQPTDEVPEEHLTAQCDMCMLCRHLRRMDDWQDPYNGCTFSAQPALRAELVSDASNS